MTPYVTHTEDMVKNLLENLKFISEEVTSSVRLKSNSHRTSSILKKMQSNHKANTDRRWRYFNKLLSQRAEMSENLLFEKEAIAETIPPLIREAMQKAKVNKENEDQAKAIFALLDFGTSILSIDPKKAVIQGMVIMMNNE